MTKRLNEKCHQRVGEKTCDRIKGHEGECLTH